jgi:hypothetical protein
MIELAAQFPLGFVDCVDILAVRLTQSLSNNKLRLLFGFFAFRLFTKVNFRHSLKTKKPVTSVTGFVSRPGFEPGTSGL